MRLALTLALAGGLGACVETGDFGRAKKSVWNDAIVTAGVLSAAQRGDTVSLYGLTDDEEELRGRAWRFLEPAQERAWFDRVVAELVATRIVPGSSVSSDYTLYHQALLDNGARSATSRYRRLSEDVMADARLIEPFARIAARVLAADAVRLRSLAFVHEIAPIEIAAAENRVSENRCLIAWVAGGLAMRLRSYRYSIEHLVIETPQADAVPVERGIAMLKAERGLIEQLGVSPIESAACAALPERTHATQDGAQDGAAGKKRPAPLPLVRKG
jgi:hypothetical protein